MLAPTMHGTPIASSAGFPAPFSLGLLQLAPAKNPPASLTNLRRVPRSPFGWIVPVVPPISSHRRPAPRGGRSFGPSKMDLARRKTDAFSGGKPMNLRFAALAAALVMSSAGCTAIKPGCGDACGGMPCHVATSQRAPRPTIFGSHGGGLGICDKLGWTQKGCGDTCGDSCGSGCGMFDRGGCGGGGGGGGCGACGGAGCNNCLQGGLSKLLDCNSCNSGGCGDGNYNFNPGPPGGQVAYPYYTTRGPRDFLMCNPPSIGPR